MKYCTYTKKICLSFGLIVFTIFFLAGYVTTASALISPPEFDQAFELLSELEEAVEDANWAEATETFELIKEKTNSIKHQLQKNIKKQKYVDGLYQYIDAVEQTISVKKDEAFQKEYIGLQRHFFSIMDSFEYKVHPLLLVVKKYLADEAVEYAEKGDAEHVAYELEEVLEFMFKIRKILVFTSVKAGEIDTFEVELKKANVLAKAKDIEKLKLKLYDVNAKYNLILSQL